MHVDVDVCVCVCVKLCPEVGTRSNQGFKAITSTYIARQINTEGGGGKEPAAGNGKRMWEKPGRKITGQVPPPLADIEIVRGSNKLIIQPAQTLKVKASERKNACG